MATKKRVSDNERLSDLPSLLRRSPEADATSKGTSGSRDFVFAFAPRSDFSYRIIRGLRAQNATARQSLFTGSLLRDCILEDIDFGRGELDGVRIEQCTFRRCSFYNIDLRSAVVAGSTFEMCGFEQALIADSLFRDVQLANCNFRNAAILDCSFEQTTFERNELTEASLTHNRFSQCRFQRMVLGDCTFAYAVLKGCTFVESSMNADSVGAVYGLTSDAISSIGFVFLGEVQAAPDTEQLIDSLLLSYAQRRWHLGVALLRITFDRAAVLPAFCDYLEGVEALLAEGVPFKRDEFRFYITVLQELAAEGRLPLLSSIASLQFIHTFTDRQQVDVKGVGTATGESVRTLESRLEHLQNAQLEQLELAHAAPSRTRGALCEVTFTFDVRPAVALVDLIHRVNRWAGLPGSGRALLLKRASGSYIEIIQATLGAVMGLQLFLYLVNGCLIQLTEARARSQILLRRKPVAAYLGAALEPRQASPPTFLRPLQKMLAQLINIPLLRDPKLQGMGAGNLKSVGVRRASRRRPSTRRQATNSSSSG